jgi:putative transposase
VGYPPQPSKDEELLKKLKKLALRHPRYGYRRIWALLKREGERINAKKILRLWRKAGLVLKRRPSRIRRKGHRVEGPLKGTHPRHVVTYDFMFDRTGDGRVLKILTVVDEFTREALAIAVGYRMIATQVMWVLARAFKSAGWPEYLRSDNGPEFIAEALETWLRGRGVVTHHIDPASPWQNAYGESFNGKLRAECLDLEVFETDTEARRVLEAWRIQYNVSRPHSSLGYRTPAEVKRGWEQKEKEVSHLPAPGALRASRGEGGQKGKTIVEG